MGGRGFPISPSRVGVGKILIDIIFILTVTRGSGLHHRITNRGTGPYVGSGTREGSFDRGSGDYSDEEADEDAYDDSYEDAYAPLLTSPDEGLHGGKERDRRG